MKWNIHPELKANRLGPKAKANPSVFELLLSVQCQQVKNKNKNKIILQQKNNYYFFIFFGGSHR